METDNFIKYLDDGDESQLNDFFTDSFNKIIDWNKVIKHNFKDKKMELFLKGYIYYYNLVKENDDPIKYLLESGNKYSYFMLAYIYYLKNDMKTTKKYFKMSEYHESYYNLGCIYYHQFKENKKQKDLEKSINYFKLSSESDNEAAYYFLGYIFETCQEIGEIYHENYIKKFIIENYLMSYKLGYNEIEIIEYFKNNFDDLIEYLIYQNNKIINLEYTKKYLYEDYDKISNENINLKLKIDCYQNMDKLEEEFNKII